MEKQLFITACRQGGMHVESALAQLYRDYGRSLWQEAWRMLRDADAANDLLQDTLLRAWRACASYRGEAELHPWLVVILRRRGIDLLRARRPEEPLEDDQGALRADVEQAAQRAGDPDASAPWQALAQRQSEAMFRRCAQRFADEQPQAAQVIRWLVEDELSPQDIAGLIDRSPGAAREYISQCRKKARHYFADWHALASTAAKAP